MQVEILSIPESAHPWTNGLAIGQVHTLTHVDHGSHDRHEFPYEGVGYGLDDLIINGIEFKVIHEKA